MAEKAAEELSKKINKHGIEDFFNSETLSDITVVNPATGAQYK